MTSHPSPVPLRRRIVAFVSRRSMHGRGRPATRGRDRVTALLGSLAIVVSVGAPGPLVPPRFDDGPPIPPYLWLSPPSGEQGGPRGASVTMPVTGGESPPLDVRTPEALPQAELVAAPGALAIGPATTSITVTILPVPAAVSPSGWQVSGNVYRVRVVDQAGAAVEGRSGSQVTLSMRAPSDFAPAGFWRLAGGAWKSIYLVASNAPDTYQATGLTTFGDFALGNNEAASGGFGGVLIVGEGLVVMALVAGAAWGLLRRRQARVSEA